jgi:2-polyprenyl-3-methyl-5-hydroxy-6-metoxy-1,4-benzoquinol methylase
MKIKKLNNELGNADLILIDQILKDRFSDQMRILDAGCGEGRNMIYFVKNGYNIYGIDQDEEAVNMAKIVCASANRSYIMENIQAFPIEENPFPDLFFDAVICINVLHSVSGHDEFFDLFDHLLRLLNNGGFLFLSMESDIGLSNRSLKKSINEEIRTLASHNFYFSSELRHEILANDQLMEIEPSKTIVIGDIKSYTYLFLKKKV